MNIPDMSHFDWGQALPYLSVLVAAVAAVGAIASAIVSRKVYLSQTRPNVIVYVDHDRSKGSIVLWVKNIGNGVAFDISFELNGLPGLDCLDRGFVDKLNKSGIKMLAPGTYVDSVVGISSDAVFRDPVGVIPVRVFYYGRSNKEGTRFCDEYFLDYDAFLGSIYTDSQERETSRAVERIADSIGKNGSGLKSEIAKAGTAIKGAIEEMSK